MEVGALGLAGGVVATFATSAITWVFSRRQAKVELSKLEQEIETMKAQRSSEVKSAEVEIMEKYRELYTAMLADVSGQLNDLKKDNSDIRKENTERRELNENLRTSLRAMEAEGKETREKLERLTKKHESVSAKLEAVTKELHQMKTDFPCQDCPRRSV